MPLLLLLGACVLRCYCLLPKHSMIGSLPPPPPPHTHTHTHHTQVDEVVLSTARRDGTRDGATALVVLQLGGTLYAAHAGVVICHHGVLVLCMVWVHVDSVGGMVP